MTPTIKDAIISLCQIHHPNDGIKIEGNNLEDISCLTLIPESEPNFTWEDVLSKEIELNQEFDAQAYARNRATEYPALAEQLDEIYHNGIDSWKATIKVTKDKYPKG
mgnify:CR=1 FL=1